MRTVRTIAVRRGNSEGLSLRQTQRGRIQGFAPARPTVYLSHEGEPAEKPAKLTLAAKAKIIEPLLLEMRTYRVKGIRRAYPSHILHALFAGKGTPKTKSMAKNRLHELPFRLQGATVDLLKSYAEAEKLRLWDAAQLFSVLANLKKARAVLFGQFGICVCGHSDDAEVTKFTAQRLAPLATLAGEIHEPIVDLLHAVWHYMEEYRKATKGLSGLKRLRARKPKRPSVSDIRKNTATLNKCLTLLRAFPKGGPLEDLKHLPGGVPGKPLIRTLPASADGYMTSNARKNLGRISKIREQELIIDLFSLLDQLDHALTILHDIHFLKTLQPDDKPFSKAYLDQLPQITSEIEKHFRQARHAIASHKTRFTNEPIPIARTEPLLDALLDVPPEQFAGLKDSDITHLQTLLERIRDKMTSGAIHDALQAVELLRKPHQDFHNKK